MRSILLPFALALCAPLVHASVPLTPAGNGHLVVPVLIDDQGPFTAILDTGADESGVYQWFADQQKFPRGANTDVGGMTGSVSMPTYSLASITVDGHTVRHLQADSYPNRKDNERQAGVVGNDFMDSTIAVFDFPCRSVEIWPKPVRLGKLLSAHAVMIKGGAVKDGTQLTFPIQVGSAKGTAVLDTGSRETKLNPQFATAAGIDPSSAAFAAGETIYGANSKGMESRVGPIGTVRFADVTIPDARAQLMDLPVFPSFGFDGPAMIFGIDLMRDIRLVYDHQAKRFWFDRSRCPA